MKTLPLFTFLAALSLAGAAYAADSTNTPDNPNCSPGVKGCTANYPTSDTTKQNPQARQSASDSQDPNNPNCSPGVKGCTANYPTGDTTKTKQK
jgi:hypothetical protein